MRISEQTLIMVALNDDTKVPMTVTEYIKHLVDEKVEERLKELGYEDTQQTS